MKRLAMVTIPALLMMLPACASTYYPDTPEGHAAYARDMAQVDAGWAAVDQSSNQLWNQVDSIAAQNQAQPYVPAARIENPNQPGTYLYFCRSLGTYVVSCTEK